MMVPAIPSRQSRASWLLYAALSVTACRAESATDAPASAGSAATSGSEAGTMAAGSGNAAGKISAGSGAPAEPSFEQAMASYQSWTRATAEPQAISVEIFSLCRAPSAAEQAFTTSEHGKNLYLQDWLNPAAVRGKAAPGKFEPGAAIVKQKLAPDTNGKLAVVALGMMIKRQRGFDAAHGDWEFGYWEPTPGLQASPAQATHCGGCHASAPSDFVFLDQSWRLP